MRKSASSLESVGTLDAPSAPPPRSASAPGEKTAEAEGVAIARDDEFGSGAPCKSTMTRAVGSRRGASDGMCVAPRGSAPSGRTHPDSQEAPMDDQRSKGSTDGLGDDQGTRVGAPDQSASAPREHSDAPTGRPHRQTGAG